MNPGVTAASGTSGLDHPPFAPGGDPRRHLYFLHIHKCAGTSVRAYLESLVRPEEVLPAYLPMEIRDPSVLRSESLRLVRGHLPLDLVDRFGRPPAVVTALRDPVTRIVSHFEFEKRWRPTYEIQSLGPIGDVALEQALDLPEVRFLLDNRMTRALTRADVGSRRKSPDEMITEAIATLDGMSWIGITEFIDDCVPLLASFVGASPVIDLPVTNVLAGRRRVDLPVWAADVMAELTAADEVVYRHGVEAARRDIDAYGRAEHVQRWSSVLTARAVDLDGEMVLRADEPFAGTSWWPAEPTAGGSALRWSGPSDRAVIDLPLRVRAGDVVELQIAATIKPELLASLGLEVNGRPVETTLHLDGGVELRGTMPAGVEGPWTSIAVLCPAAPWSDIHPETEDSSRRGVAFTSIRLVPLAR